MTRVCSKCGETKPISEFYHRKDRPTGYSSSCITCNRLKVRKYREAHLNEIKEKDNIKRLDIPYRLHRSCKHSARRRGLEFTIEVSDIVVPTHCPYLGVELTNTLQEGFQDYNPSIDRIDSNKGYTKDNIEVISVLANRMKSDADMEQLRLFAHHVLERHRARQL